MLKNKKIIILFGIILVAILIFINPTESRASDEYTITRTTTIQNWNNEIFGYDIYINMPSTVLSPFSEHYDSSYEAEYDYTVIFTGTINGVENQTVECTSESNILDRREFGFDYGTDVAITETWDFTDWVNNQSQLGSYEFQGSYYDFFYIEDYNLKNISSELTSYVFGAYSNYYECPTFYLTILNNIDSNGVPDGTYQRIFKAYSYNGTDLGTINLPTFVANITTRVSGNMAKTDGFFDGYRFGTGDIPANSTVNVYYKGFSRGDYIDESGESAYSPSMNDMFANYVVDDGVPNAYYYDGSSDYSEPYTITGKMNSKDFSKITDTNAEILPQKDAQGNYTGVFYTNIELEATKNGSSSYTGVAYNILPFAVIITIALVGIVLMKKTKSKNGGARYE